MADEVMNNPNDRKQSIGEQPKDLVIIQSPLTGETKVEKVPIGKAEIKKARETYKRYAEGKANLEARIIENEEWYKMRHWKQMRKHRDDVDKNEPMPASGWLFNCIMSKHADCMDSYPEPNILPREEGDKAEAKTLSSIVPLILEQNDFEQVYSDACWYKLKNGTACYGIFWDTKKLNGLGDVTIKKIDLLNLFWEPGITDIQKSRNVFQTQLVDIDVLEEMYPELKGQIKNADNYEQKKYEYDDNIRTDNKAVVYDWYYRKQVGHKKVLHYCKFVGEHVLFSSENDSFNARQQSEELREQVVVATEGQIIPPEPPKDGGWYDHGKYPFVFDVLFPEEGLPTGFGYIDVCKEAQESIDRLNNDIEINTRWGARPRWFMRADGGINEEEYNDLRKSIVHVDGNLGDDSLKRIDSQDLSPIYLNILDAKISELKETSGNRDVNNGGATAGVTAASGIAAMQEQSGKTSRDMLQASYRAYKEIVNFVIELIRQFYDMPRQFRILGERGQEEFMSYSNAGIKPQAQGEEFGVNMGYRLPVFDIKVSAQKQNPYSKTSQNEMALQFYNAGFFNPDNSDSALACIDMMDFNDKDSVVAKIQANGTMYTTILQLQQQMLQLAEMVDATNGTNIAQGIAMGVLNGDGVGNKGTTINIPETTQDGSLKQKENSIVANARERANESTSPR